MHCGGVPQYRANEERSLYEVSGSWRAGCHQPARAQKKARWPPARSPTFRRSAVYASAGAAEMSGSMRSVPRAGAVLPVGYAVWRRAHGQRRPQPPRLGMEYRPATSMCVMSLGCHLGRVLFAARQRKICPHMPRGVACRYAWSQWRRLNKVVVLPQLVSPLFRMVFEQQRGGGVNVGVRRDGATCVGIMRHVRGEFSFKRPTFRT